MEKLDLKLAMLLYSRFATIYGDKFLKPSHDKDFINRWCEEWISGLKGIDTKLIKGALEECKLTLEWPPTIAEFRKFCDKGAGFPSWPRCLQSIIRQDFNHPITFIVYQKVGKWAIQNDKEDTLRKKVEDAYQEALTEYRSSPTHAHQLLSEYLDKSKQKLIENYKPSSAELKSFKERLKEYQLKAAEEKTKRAHKPHPEWKPTFYRKDSQSFREDIFNERRRYLINLDEIEAATIDLESWYDRIRYLRELEALEYLNRIGYVSKER